MILPEISNHPSAPAKKAFKTLSLNLNPSNQCQPTHNHNLVGPGQVVIPIDIWYQPCKTHLVSTNKTTIKPTKQQSQSDLGHVGPSNVMHINHIIPYPTTIQPSTPIPRQPTWLTTITTRSTPGRWWPAMSWMSRALHLARSPSVCKHWMSINEHCQSCRR